MHSPTSPPHSEHKGGGGSIFVEIVRLAVVVLATATAFRVTDGLAVAEQLSADADTVALMGTLLGAGVGYVAGGALGRFSLGRIDAAERRLSALSSGELLASVIGAFAGGLVAAGLVWPVLLFDGKLLTVPLAVLVSVVLVMTGLRVGLSRGGDLLRYVGASGRLSVASPTRGSSAKVVDTSALVDGRVVDVCRAGFLDGTLVLPRFVLYELQGLADAADPDRKTRGRRGLDVLAALQRSAGVALEVADRDYPDIVDVDAKLVAMARERGASLVTVDGNLGRVAEVQGVKVLNLNALAETLRPPVLPGDVLYVRVLRPGKERGQGVGYLSDGTMVVCEGGREYQGSEVTAEVTSILSNPNGRMVFATVQEKASPARSYVASPT